MKWLLAAVYLVIAGGCLVNVISLSTTSTGPDMLGIVFAVAIVFAGVYGASSIVKT